MAWCRRLSASTPENERADEEHGFGSRGGFCGVMGGRDL